MADFEEKRQVERHPIPTLVDLTISKENYRIEYSKNFSKAGAYLETERLLPVGTPMVLRFVLPELDWAFEIESKVIWTTNTTDEEKLDGKRDGLGISFVSMDEKDSEKITSYMDNFDPEEIL